MDDPVDVSVELPPRLNQIGGNPANQNRRMLLNNKTSN